jgi:hypothetical protein
MRAQDAPEDRLAPLAWLVGGTWTAETTPPSGGSVTVEATFTWAPHRQALTYSLLKRSANGVQPGLVGLCGWHPAKKALVLLEIGENGNLTEGTLRADGARISYDETIYAGDGSALPVRAEAIRESDDRFVFRAYVEKDGAWTRAFEALYRRRTP